MTKRFTVRVPDKNHKIIKEIAQANGRTINYFANEAISNYIDEFFIKWGPKSVEEKETMMKQIAADGEKDEQLQ